MRAQTVVTEDDSVAFLAFLLRLAALVYIADVCSQCVGFDKLFRAGRALVLQLRIVLHFVPLELVEPRHYSLTDRTGDVKSLFLSRRLRDGQPLPSVGRVVNGKVRQTEENFFAILKIALEGRTTIAGMMSPEVVSSGECFVTLLALERLFAVLPRLVPCQNSFGLEPATAIPALIIFHIFFFWGTVQVEIGISQLGVHHVLKIEDVFWCDLSRSRSKTDVNSNLEPQK